MNGPGGPTKFLVGPGTRTTGVGGPGGPLVDMDPGGLLDKLRGPGGLLDELGGPGGLVEVLGGPGGPTRNKFWGRDKIVVDEGRLFVSLVFVSSPLSTSLILSPSLSVGCRSFNLRRFIASFCNVIMFNICSAFLSYSSENFT